MASGRPGAGPQQPSFKTNVNRMKTKRWVEAKSYSYDGDDWGEADEYDEYDGYDDPPQESLPGPATGAYGHGHPPYAQNPGRSGSPVRAPFAQDPRERSGSFGRGDETRSFSGPPGSGSPRIAPIHTAYGSGPGRGPPGSPRSQPHQGYPQGRPSMEHQRPGPPSGHFSPVGPKPFAGPDNGGRTSSMGSQGSAAALSFAQRRDFSSSSAPAPQYPSTARPPRKSSLSQDGAPSPQAMQSFATQAGQNTQPEGGNGAETSGPAIIRPADIYKRVAQEKEKERLSQESARPSMSELNVANDSSAGEEPGHGLRPRKQTLDTVAERKSEYGIENLVSQTQAPPAQSKPSASPQLPQFESNSGFGLDFSSSFDQDPSQKNTAQRQVNVDPQEPAKKDFSRREADVPKHASGVAEHAASLSHQPSQGFRSAVHQAFDEPVAPTPAGSDIVRSDTTSTSAISPIISRNATKAQQEANAKGISINMGSIAEEASAGRTSIEDPTAGLRQGHRRSMNPPSPGNSPARQAQLEVKNDTTGSSQRGVVDETTPIEETRRQRSASAAKAAAIQNVVETLSSQAQQSPTSQTLQDRSESPSKGRVRNLVDKAESTSSSRRGSQSSLPGTTPSQERADAIRSQLPGGWNSYTTNQKSPVEMQGSQRQSEDNRPSSLPGAPINPSLTGQSGNSPRSDIVTPDVSKEGLDPEPTTERRSVSHRDAPVMLPPGGSTASSIMPTPKGYSPMQSSENLPGNVPAVAPLRQRVGGGPSSANILNVTGAPPIQPQGAASPTGSLDASPLDENDQLSRDIVRQLSPNPPGDINEPRDEILAAPTGGKSQEAPPAQQSDPTDQALIEQHPSQPQHDLRRRFSWEEGGEELNGSDAPEQPAKAAPPVASNYRPPKSFGSILGQPGSAPSAVPAQKSVDVEDAPPHQPVQVQSRPSQEPAFQEKAPYQTSLPAIGSQPQSPQVKSSPGFASDSSPVVKPAETSVNNIQTQVVSIQPEQEDESKQSLPPTPAAKDSIPPTPISKDPPKISSDSEPASPVQQMPQPLEQVQPTVQGARQVGQAPPLGQAPITPFREILAMESPEDRLRVYRNTQDTFYHMNTGLGNWIQVMGEKHPEHKALLQSRGQFTTPTPGMSGPSRPPQPGSTSASGPSFGGLRKPGSAAVTPAMSDAGAALKSATRDTKKLAKGLFAKGKSRFGGRDKAPFKLASPSRPSNVASPSEQATYIPYRPNAQSSQPAQPAQFPPSVQPPDYAPPVHSNESAQPTHTYQAYKPSPRLDDPTVESSTSPDYEPTRQGVQTSANLQRSGDVAVAAGPIATETQIDRPSDVGTQEKKLPPPPPIPESPPDAKPLLKQRLTVHHKQMEPFEVTFPDDLFIPAKFTEATDKPISSASGSAAKAPAAKEGSSAASTPRREKFPTRTSSRAARTLDPGKSGHPSWLNFTPPIGTPTTLEFLARVGSPNSSSPATSPPAPKSPQNPQPVQTPTGISAMDSVISSSDQKTATSEEPAEEERPFSFINFSESNNADLSFDETAFKVQPIERRRESSVATVSTAEMNSRPSTREQADHFETDATPPASISGGKPLPSLPPLRDDSLNVKTHPPQQHAPQTMPAGQNQGPRPSFSLFPQTRPRGNTQNSLGGDYGPPVARPGTGGSGGFAMATASTMPATNTRHKRSLSGGASNLLERAMTKLPDGGSPRREKMQPEAPKNDKKKRRMSGLGGFGNFLQQARGQIKDATAPWRSQGQPDQTQNRPYTPNQSQGYGEQTYRSYSSQDSYRPYSRQAAGAQYTNQRRATDAEPVAQVQHGSLNYQHTPPVGSRGTGGDISQSPVTAQAPPAALVPSTDERSSSRLSAALSTSPLHSKFSPYRPNTSEKSPAVSALTSSQNSSLKTEQTTKQYANPSPHKQQEKHKPRDLNLRPEALSNSDSRGSTDLTTRPPDSAQSRDGSMQQGLSPRAASHKPSRSNASVTSRRSHAPSLSINTNVPSPNTPRQDHHANLKPNGQDINDDKSSNRNKEVGPDSNRGQFTESDETESNIKHSTQGQESRPKLEAGKETQDEPDYYDDEDDAPSDLEALPGLEQQPVSAANTVSALPSATPATATPGTGEGDMPPLPTTQDGVASRRGTGKRNRITLTPSALRIARQREIEIGGETRMNSPEATPESAKNKRLGHGRESSGLGIELEEGEGAKNEKEETSSEEDDIKRGAEDVDVESKEARKKTLTVGESDDDLPQMTATSFPGQEWNPYGPF